MSRTKAALIYGLLGLGALTMLAPLGWMISTALKTPEEVFRFPPAWLPDRPAWHNFARAWQAAPFGRFYFNSLLIAGAVTLGQVLTSALAGYSFARLRFPGRDRIFFGYLATMMIPGSVTMIPVFILVRLLGWVDTYWALIVPGIFSAYGTFMLRQFFLSIPKELEEAATIDGCGYVRTFLQVVLPLSKPALATLTIFTFMGTWGSFLWPLVVTHSAEMRTLPVGLMVFQSGYTTEWSLLMAASLLVMLPMIVLFLVNQRYFVEGIKLSGFGGT